MPLIIHNSPMVWSNRYFLFMFKYVWTRFSLSLVCCRRLERHVSKCLCLCSSTTFLGFLLLVQLLSYSVAKSHFEDGPLFSAHVGRGRMLSKRVQRTDWHQKFGFVFLSLWIFCQFLTDYHNFSRNHSYRVFTRFFFIPVTWWKYWRVKHQTLSKGLTPKVWFWVPFYLYFFVLLADKKYLWR